MTLPFNDPQQLIACLECDLVMKKPRLAPGTKAVCHRCGFIITENKINALAKATSYSLTALVLFIIANIFPFLSFTASGQGQTISLFDSVSALYYLGYVELSVLLFILIILIPLIFLFSTLYLLLPLLFNIVIPGIKTVHNITFHMIHWSMVEVFMVGILVSLVKLAGMAEVVLGVSFWAYCLFTVSLVLVISHLDKYQIWQNIQSIQRSNHHGTI